MTEPADAGGDASELAFLSAARSGDEEAFRRLTDLYARELHLHCYRMLGSLHDAEDLLQETLLRAWKGLGRSRGRAPLRSRLHRIATNACLTELARRPRQEPPRLAAPPADPTAPHVPFASDILHLEPYPDRLLDAAEAADPHARYLARETVELAFLTAIKRLPPRQRTALLLREVVGFSAREVAELLETTVPAVNSALQRARAALEGEPARLSSSAGSRDAVEAGLLRRFMRAWEEADMAALAALLSEDAVLTMPPAPSWYLGRDAIVAFVSSFVFPDGKPHLRVVPTRANRRPACAAYDLDREAGTFRAYGIMVVRFEQDLVAEITGFGNPALFRFFGLPAELAP